MNNSNLNENEMKNIKNLVDNGNISEAISHISPEMIQNFSKILSNSQQNSQQTSNNTQQNDNQNENNGFDFSKIDINALAKMSSAFNNSKNDPRANLLNSLRPYLRDSKKGQLDNYMNLLNVSKIAEIMKNNNKENNNNV